ncbi:MAG: hypothetical protein JJU21_03505 [Salinarimonas sp.]|nr:hypothetical protein [Salinarimonas sp.]
MNRKMEKSELSSIADTVTQDGSPAHGHEQGRPFLRGFGRRATDQQGQVPMNDREESARSAGSDLNSGAHGKPQLDRPTQTRIGDQLRSMYAELMDQPVPDRFRALLDQLDEAGNKQKADRGDGK